MFDGPDAVALAREDLASVPIEEFPALRLAWVPASAIVELAWTIDELWSSIESGTSVEAPQPETRSVLVWRREVRVLHRALDPDEAALARS